MPTKSLSNLRKSKSLSDLADLVGYTPKQVSYLLYVIKEENKYDEFTIPKKRGGERVIKAPKKNLRHLQRRLAWHLSNCFDAIYVKKQYKKPLSHGFRRKHSILTNASVHRGKRYVFNIDLKDFFPSINFGRVRGFFISNSNFELETKVATIIAQIACHDESLPQGAPTSPVISNFIGHILDVRMVQLAKKAKCTYSRYADDLTFSTNANTFPDIIAKEIESDVWGPSDTLIKLVEKAGFEINPAKTVMQYNNRRQVVTGIVVNKKVNVKREYYKQTRVMCHSLFKSGEYYLSEHLVGGPISNKDEKVRIAGNINQLNGILNYIYHVKKFEINRPYETKQKREHKESDALIAIKNIYRKFFYYKYFKALEMPLILTEGKTDVIYLKCALQRLYKSYPELIEKDGKLLKSKIKLFSQPDAFMVCCNIAEGTTGLVKIMSDYEKVMKNFHEGGKAHPVILLVDNDSGANTVFGKLGEKDRTKPFYHFKENLYVVATPLSKAGKETSIEDFFQKKLLKEKLSGKIFNPAKKIDRDKEYSKNHFAEYVVKKKQDEIKFSGFKGILDRIQMVKSDYAKRYGEKDKV